MASVIIFGSQLHAAEDEDNPDFDGPDLSGESENASNPLAAVSNTDLRWQYSDLTTNEAHLNNYYIDGAIMPNPKLKSGIELPIWRKLVVSVDVRIPVSVSTLSIFSALP